jgi:hypothetical protein
MMSGTGALRQFVLKAVRLGSRAAFGYPPLALGQTPLAVHNKAFATNSRASGALTTFALTARLVVGRGDPDGCEVLLGFNPRCGNSQQDNAKPRKQVETGHPGHPKFTRARKSDL